VTLNADERLQLESLARSRSMSAALVISTTISSLRLIAYDVGQGHLADFP
jgi:hypothetical protein